MTKESADIAIDKKGLRVKWSKIFQVSAWVLGAAGWAIGGWLWVSATQVGAASIERDGNLTTRCAHLQDQINLLKGELVGIKFAVDSTNTNLSTFMKAMGVQPKDKP